MDPTQMLPTYTVKREDGVVCRINQRDYDPKTHKIVDDVAPVAPAAEPEQPVAATEPKQPAPAAPVAPAAEPEQPAVTPSLGVSKIGRKFFVVNLADGKPVELDGIDADGYKSDTDAIAAAQKVIANA